MDPLTAAAFGGQALSSILGWRAGRSAEDAADAALANAAVKNEEFRRRAAAQFAQTLAAFDPGAQTAGINRRAVSRTAALTGNQKPLEALPGAGSAPQGYRQQAAQALSEALTEGRRYAERLARTGAYGENQFDNGITLNRGAEAQSLIADEAGGISRVLPYQLAAAQSKAVDPLADFLAGVSQMAAVGGGIGWGKGLFGGAPAYPVSPAVKTGGAL